MDGQLKRRRNIALAQREPNIPLGKDQLWYDEHESVSEETVHKDTNAPARKTRVDIAERFPVFRTIGIPEVASFH